jgi:hypothetical protein
MDAYKHCYFLCLLWASVFLIVTFPASAKGLSCFGQEIAKIDLDAQWGETRSQISGTCYAHQQAALFSSALYRSRLPASAGNPEVCAISPDACALYICPANRQNILEAKRRFSSALVNNEDFDLLSGSSATIGDTLKDILKQKLPLDSGVREELEKIQNKAINNKEIHEIRIAFDEIFLLLKLNEKPDSLTTAENQAREKLLKKHPNPEKTINDLENKAIALLTESCKQLDCGREWLKTRDALEFSQTHQSERLFPEEPRKDRNSQRKCEQDPDFRDKLVENLSSAICLGIPVGVDIKMNSNVEARSQNTAGKWGPVGAGEGIHAIALKGWVTEGDNTFLVFRNSWGKESELRLPLQNICQIVDAAALMANKEAIAFRDKKLGSELFKKRSQEDAKQFFKEFMPVVLADEPPLKKGGTQHKENLK